MVRGLRRLPALPGSALSGPELHPRLAPLEFLLGDWHGLGVVGYPTMTERRFEEELSFAHDGRPFLAYTSRTWLIDDDGQRLGPAHVESGYWRPGTGERDVEAVITSPTGVAAVYDGEVVFRKVELATTGVGLTPTAKRVTGLHRLYGIVEDGDLAYAVDMAAVGQELQPHFSARLQKR